MSAQYKKDSLPQKPPIRNTLDTSRSAPLNEDPSRSSYLKMQLAFFIRQFPIQTHQLNRRFVIHLVPPSRPIAFQVQLSPYPLPDGIPVPSNLTRNGMTISRSHIVVRAENCCFSTLKLSDLGLYNRFPAPDASQYLVVTFVALFESAERLGVVRRY